MPLESYIRAMPKVELHVHLEGAIQPTTLLKLAQRHGIALPAESEEGLRAWYRFSDFDHFVQVYMAISQCIRTPEDIELIAWEFLRGQASQNIVYSEVTFTAHTHWATKGLSFATQIEAINRARERALRELGIAMRLVIDIPRYVSAEEGEMVAEWAISGMDNGVVGLGLGGPEQGNPAERYSTAFTLAKNAGLASLPHAGETVGPESIWSALSHLQADRLGHGVRCMEDPELVALLRERQIPLEVCPTSNVCLNVVPEFAAHPLPRLLEEGLMICLGSDDPPMFNTTLTGEYLECAKYFGFDAGLLDGLVLNAVEASRLNQTERAILRKRVLQEAEELKPAHLP